MEISSGNFSRNIDTEAHVLYKECNEKKSTEIANGF